MSFIAPVRLVRSAPLAVRPSDFQSNTPLRPNAPCPLKSQMKFSGGKKLGRELTAGIVLMLTSAFGMGGLGALCGFNTMDAIMPQSAIQALNANPDTPALEIGEKFRAQHTHHINNLPEYGIVYLKAFDWLDQESGMSVEDAQNTKQLILTLCDSNKALDERADAYRVWAEKTLSKYTTPEIASRIGEVGSGDIKSGEHLRGGLALMLLVVALIGVKVSYDVAKGVEKPVTA